MDSPSLKFSVVIVTFHRHKLLCDTLRALASHIDPSIGEVIVIDQCPMELLPVDVLSTPGLRYITLNRAGMVAARNVGIRYALGNVILFLDDDVIPTPELIPAHCQAYDDPLVGGVAGRILDPGQSGSLPPHPELFNMAEGWRYAHFDHLFSGNVATSRGCNMSFRRNLLLRLGGFDTNFAIFRDDTDMCFRVIASGYVIRFVPTAELVHLNASNGGTRGTASSATGSWRREMRMYYQLHRHYCDNLYFILKHFRWLKRLKWLVDAYQTYVGLSRWPWRLVAKNAFFGLALIHASHLRRSAEYARLTPIGTGEGGSNPIDYAHHLPEAGLSTGL